MDRDPCTYSVRRLRRTQSWSRSFVEDKILIPAGIGPRFLGHPSRTLKTTTGKQTEKLTVVPVGWPEEEISTPKKIGIFLLPNLCLFASPILQLNKRQSAKFITDLQL
jgi:hypothetical protein